MELIGVFLGVVALVIGIYHVVEIKDPVVRGRPALPESVLHVSGYVMVEALPVVLNVTAEKPLIIFLDLGPITFLCKVYDDDRWSLFMSTCCHRES